MGDTAFEAHPWLAGYGAFERVIHVLDYIWELTFWYKLDASGTCHVQIAQFLLDLFAPSVSEQGVRA